MKPRLFVVMLAAFALVIILGLGGMIGFFALAVTGRVHMADSPATTAVSDITTLQTRYAEQLGNYYSTRGSWNGVRQRLRDGDLVNPELVTYSVIDTNGQVVAASQFGAPPAPPAPGGGVPIEVDGRRVGTLVIGVTRTPFMMDQRTPLAIARGFLSGALGLAAVLLILATFFSSRISTPLRRLTRATQAMASGDMSVRVSGHHIREVNDLAQSFNAMAEALTEADQQRRQLTADVAHELRTPLSIIKGRLEGIQDGVYQANPEQVTGLLAETALLERLIEDLRVLALADAGQLPLYVGSLDPADLLYDIAESFEPEANERGVHIEVQAEEELPILHADPQRIAQVAGNLVSNALRHTPAGGTVRLSVEAINNAKEPTARLATNVPAIQMLRFTVSDTGMGIAAEDLPHIFDRFWRADRARTRSSGGAGLGLAIVRRIVEAHGGTIEATSTLGRGTSISWTLPVGNGEPLGNPARRGVTAAS